MTLAVDVTDGRGLSNKEHCEFLPKKSNHPIFTYNYYLMVESIHSPNFSSPNAQTVNSPNFLAPKLSCYTVLVTALLESIDQCL